MKASSESIENLFKSKRFRIPLYQRSYGWGESHCKSLWDDFKALHKKLKYDEKGFHYLGTMVIEKDEDGVCKIVDGQQRTTSLMLLIKAIGDKFKFTVDEYLFVNGDGDPRHSPQHLGEDDETSEYRHFVNVIKEKEKCKDIDCLFQINLGIFKSFLDDEDEITKDDLEKVLGRMEVAWVELNDSEQKDDSQLIFEKMNSGGKIIEIHDLIRNYIFLLAAESKRADNYFAATGKEKSIYINEWMNLENEFPERALGQMKDFLRDYLIIKTEHTSIRAIGELYFRFKEWIDSEVFKDEFGEKSQYSSIEKLANDLWRYADYWGKCVFANPFTVAGGKKEVGVKSAQKVLKEFSRIANAPFYPLALRIMAQHDNNPDMLSKLFEVLSKFILICQLTNKKVPVKEKTFDLDIDTVAGLMVSLNKLWGSDFKIEDELEKVLKGVLEANVSDVYEVGNGKQTGDEPEEEPNDKVFYTEEGVVRLDESFQVSDVYSLGKILVNLLLKINNNILTGDSEIDFVEGVKHSLEHIMPQTLDKKNDWGFLEGSSVHQNYLHSLGNMTLVGQAYNSKISNESFGKKKEHYKNSSYAITREVESRFSDWYQNKDRSEVLMEFIYNLSEGSGDLESDLRDKAGDIANAVEGDSKVILLEKMLKDRSKELLAATIKVLKWGSN